VTDTIPKTRPSASAQKLIQLTDCHLYADPDANYKGVPPGRTLQYVCRHIAERHPDAAALLLTGDLSQDESIASYAWLKSVMAQFRVPVYAIPGNHDRPEHMHSVFDDVIKLAPGMTLDYWKIHLLDSSVPGKTGGRVTESALDRLRGDLQSETDTPCLVALHHHPIPIGSAWMDRLGLENGDDLNSILQRHAQVKGVLFGHIHQEFAQRTGHILYLGSPSTCIQFTPDSPLYAVDTRPPAYRVLNLNMSGIFDTYIEYVALPLNPWANNSFPV
jgi:Icc protein